MFEDLYDEISKLLSWRWPVAQGRVVLAEIERVRHQSSKGDTLRLSVVYNFWVNDDGPYGGEGFWTPAFSIGAVNRLREAKRKFHVGTPVAVRYRPDDPSVNKLDREARKEL